MDSHGMIVHLPTILPYKTIHVGKYTRQPMGILWEQKKTCFLLKARYGDHTSRIFLIL